jgi:hypothetical protein
MAYRRRTQRQPFCHRTKHRRDGIFACFVSDSPKYRLSDIPFRRPRKLLGVRYYRLKMVDQNGNYEYSRPLSLVDQGELTAGPNPVRETLKVLAEDPLLTGTEALVYDLLGLIRHRFTLTGTTEETSLKHLSPGLYLLRFQPEKQSDSSSSSLVREAGSEQPRLFLRPVPYLLNDPASFPSLVSCVSSSSDQGRPSVRRMQFSN